MDSFLIKRYTFIVLLLLSLSAGSVVALNSNIINVMSFNLRFASASDGDDNWQNPGQTPERREVVVTTITNHQPHLIGFQEAETNQLDYLEAELPARYAFERQRPSGGGGNEHVAFAYDTNQLELLDRGVISLGNSPGGGSWNNTPGTAFDPFDLFPENNFAFPRIALWGRFKWRCTAQEFLFYTTHFDTFNGANNGESEVKSAFLITDDVLARNNLMPASPLAVAVGDFNSSQNDRAWQLFTGSFMTNSLTGDFTDAWFALHGTFTDSGTFHGFNGGTVSGASRIDWILYRGGFLATQSVIVTDSAIATGCATCPRNQYPSDHYPVFASLVFPDPLPDYDRDGLPDDAELASSISLPADPDTDNDGLLDGEEDLDGDGVVEGGESDPGNGTDRQGPTDIRHYAMDGLTDFPSKLLASNGLDLFWRFDGRYLYVATQDAGEGNDHFIFVVTNPNDAVSAPFAKVGQVARWDLFLADENDNDFSGWFDASGNQITNLYEARSAIYFENAGSLEGVIDLSLLYGAGFTNSFYLAAAPYATADGGALFPGAQVPAGNGDGDILGTNEYVRIDPGDRDGDGIGDLADPDQDGDGLADGWELAYGLDPESALGINGADGDPDGDGTGNADEFLASTSPTNGASVLKLLSVSSQGPDVTLQWLAVHGMTYRVQAVEGGTISNGAYWMDLFTNEYNVVFPAATNAIQVPVGSARIGFFRLSVD